MTDFNKERERAVIASLANKIRDENLGMSPGRRRMMERMTQEKQEALNTLVKKEQQEALEYAKKQVVPERDEPTWLKGYPVSKKMMRKGK